MKPHRRRTRTDWIAQNEGEKKPDVSLEGLGLFRSIIRYIPLQHGHCERLPPTKLPFPVFSSSKKMDSFSMTVRLLAS